MSGRNLQYSVSPLLPAVAEEVLHSLYQHRVLTAAQIRVMHASHAHLRWTQHVLHELTTHRLVMFARSGRGGARLYFLTPAGVGVVEQTPTRVESRRTLLEPEQAAGVLQAHTHAVNQTGIAFLQAARQRGDECGPLAWRHEIAHRISRGGPGQKAQRLIADALLTYLQTSGEGELVIHTRLVEVDRATMPAETLAAKLARYANLYHYTPPTRRGHAPAGPGWKEQYELFPGVLCLLAGKPRPLLERRIQLVLALTAADHNLTDTPQVKVSIGLLEDLEQHGPFAAVLQRPGQTRRLNWLGKPDGQAHA